jgi:hypothetical protein
VNHLQYMCGTPLRRQSVKDSASINGIDYLEVYTSKVLSTSSNYRSLLIVYCFKNIDSHGLHEENILIQGGVRRKSIKAEWADSASTILQDIANGVHTRITDDLAEDERKIMNELVPPFDHILIIRTTGIGDFSTYSLHLVASPEIPLPPLGFDTLLSNLDFSFRVNCPSDFDCKIKNYCIEETLVDPAIDYTAKDFASFRRLALDRLSVIIPNWKERNPSDSGIMIVELISYLADHLSYYQDAVATEAYLGTARKRISVKRHARLLDYFMHDGCNARAWVCFAISGNEDGPDSFFLKKGTKLLTKDYNALESQELIVRSEQIDDSLRKGSEVFETMHNLNIYKSNDEILFYTWGDSQCCLPKGSTSATIRNDNNKFDLPLFNWSNVINDIPPNSDEISKLKETFSEVLDLEWLSKGGALLQLEHISNKLTRLTDGVNSLYLELNDDENQVTVRPSENSRSALYILFASKDASGDLIIFTTTVKAGNVLIFEEIASPSTYQKVDADPSHRHAVRLSRVSRNFDELFNVPVLEIAWEDEDALPFTLCISIPQDTRAGSHDETDLTAERIISVARGNVVLADHGYTLIRRVGPPSLETYYDKFVDLNENLSIPNDDEKLSSFKFMETTSFKEASEFLGYAPYPEVNEFKFKPHLSEGPLTYAESFDKSLPASLAFANNPRNARPRISIFGRDENDSWNPAQDLLNTSAFDKSFVVEMENDGSTFIRFPKLVADKLGDDAVSTTSMSSSPFSPDPPPLPSAPREVFPLFARYRIGNGVRGNVGAESITRVVLDAVEKSLFSDIRNPLSASGGHEPEDMELVRLYAPEAFRTQERAVTAEDYAMTLRRHPQVQKAYATIRWTGSWFTVFVAIDRYGGKAVDKEFKDNIRRFLNYYRLAGYDLEISEPIYIPLQIRIGLCVKPSYYFNNVYQKLSKVFSNRDNPDGAKGFFHPDNLSFGQPVLLSKIYEATMSVEGVASCKVELFQRWGKTPNNEIENGMIEMEYFEIPRLDNDPNFPENGKIEFISGSTIK